MAAQPGAFGELFLGKPGGLPKVAQQRAESLFCDRHRHLSLMFGSGVYGARCTRGPRRPTRWETGRVDLDTFRWLLTDAGQELLGRATEAPREELKAQAQLRQVAPGSEEERAARVAAAIGQVTLRRKAAAKFGNDAAAMYFTTDGLEQATRATVAAHRAARLAAASAGSVIDLGCGIGGDLLAFARAGITSAGIDVDPVRVEVARANLAALGLPGAVSVADATTVDTTPFDAAYVDPARRTGRGRTFTIDDWNPPWTFVEQLMHRDTCVKAAPGFPHARIPEDVEAEWVSDSGEVKEAVLWSGRLATTRRRATVIGHGGLATLTDEDDPGAGRPATSGSSSTSQTVR